MDEINLDYETLSLFSLFDVIAVPFTGMLLFVIARQYFRKKEDDLTLRPIYYWAFFLKIGMILVYAALVQFYWKIGDTKGYYIDLLKLQIAAAENTDVLSALYFTSTENFLTNYSYDVLGYVPGAASIYLYKLVLPINVICFQNYMATSMIINFFSFLGAWKMFKVFRSLYPKAVKGAAFATLFYPSVLFWSSVGIMKDPITFGALGFLLHGIFLMIKKQNSVRNTIAVIVFALMLLVLKSYILITFIGGAFLWISLTLIGKIKTPPLRRLVMLTAFFVVIIGTFIFFQGEATDKANDAPAAIINTDQALGIAAALKEQYSTTDAGSSFQVDISYTTGGLISFIPTAMVICLFRPFIWESGNLIMLLSAAEGLFILIFLLYLFFKRGLLARFGLIFRDDKFIILLLVFPLIFFFTIALSTFNFGTLTRYKIPVLPFFVFLLFVLDYKTRNGKEVKKIHSRKTFAN